MNNSSLSILPILMKNSWITQVQGYANLLKCGLWLSLNSILLICFKKLLHLLKLILINGNTNFSSRFVFCAWSFLMPLFFVLSSFYFLFFDHLYFKRSQRIILLWLGTFFKLVRLDLISRKVRSLRELLNNEWILIVLIRFTLSWLLKINWDIVLILIRFELILINFKGRWLTLIIGVKNAGIDLWMMINECVLD